VVDYQDEEEIFDVKQKFVIVVNFLDYNLTTKQSLHSSYFLFNLQKLNFAGIKLVCSPPMSRMSIIQCSAELESKNPI
jgi:hypothetical protein